MAHARYVAYYRVSTARQGASGLGLEAQQAAVRGYLVNGRGELTEELTEVESGQNNDRPQLECALRLCRLTGATLIIAKLDRLSRDAHFLLGLQKGSVPFVAADMPEANELTVSIMAVVAQAERKAISRRTKEALAMAKARGVKLGGWRGGPVVDGKLGGRATAAQATAFAAEVGPILAGMRGEGLSLRAMAAELGRRGIRTPRNATWSASAVRNVLVRVEAGALHTS